MKYKALVSAHIFRNEDGSTNIETFNRIDNDKNYTGIFDDIEHALLDQVDPNFDQSGSYFFIASVESKFVSWQNWEGTEYDTEHEVKVIKCFEDLPQAIGTNESA